MKLQDLPKDMQEDIKKLAREHPITLDEAVDFYLMGGNNHANILCKLKSMKVLGVVIEIENNRLWNDYNKKMFATLKNE